MTPRLPLGSIEPAALWLALLQVPGSTRRRLHVLRERFPDPEQLLRLSPPRRRAWLPPRFAEQLDAAFDVGAAQAQLRRLERLGGRVLLAGQSGFPASLAEIPDPPLLLFVSGGLPVGPAVGIVGARKATLRGRRFAEALAQEATRCGLAVVSGLAYGIDAAAHAGALAGTAGAASECAPGVAVWASGFDRPAPRGNAELAHRILRDGGAWISEYPPGHGARAHQFPERNRLISGLAQVTVVVEAEQASGSLWTARHALDQGRDVMAVPGPVDLAVCRGSNGLLRDGAAPLLEPADLFAAYGVAPRPANVPAPQRAPARGADESTPAAAPRTPTPAQRIVERLSEAPAEQDDLARELELSASELARACLELELEGVVQRSGGLLSLRPGAR